MMKRSWIIGSRGSKLALKQTEITINRLKSLYPDHDFGIKIIKTTGDTIWDKPLPLIGGKGLFVKEIEEALLKGEIDMAVHSMKDLPTEIKDELTIAAMLEREDPRDVFISDRYDRLSDVRPDGTIGTSSTRRRSQILHYLKDIRVVDLRGNVDTRIKKLSHLKLDGIILAYAGVKRMGFEERIKEILPLDVMVPPSGQGAVGIETRKDTGALEIVRPINHERTFMEVTLERAIQSGIGGGCQIPLGINASIKNSKIELYLALGGEKGGLLIKKRLEGSIDKEKELIENALKALNKTNAP
ncbi:MAG: hydroxymethylbilane synthase [Syntrophorhabdaceae bacterium]|nr:hydroxymethylbilane synthase [Syntrophorhabdaceae bacterium]